MAPPKQPQRKPTEEEEPRQTPGDSYPLQQPLPPTNPPSPPPNDSLPKQSQARPQPAGAFNDARAQSAARPVQPAVGFNDARSQSAAKPNTIVAPPPKTTRPQPTDFTNFSRRFSANQAASESYASRLSKGATAKQDAAAASLKAAQDKFAKESAAGMVEDPYADAWSGHTHSSSTASPSADVVAPDSAKGASGASVPAANPSEAPGGGASQVGGGASPVIGPTPDNPSGDPTIAAMLAKAGQTYSGPGGLDTLDAADKANAADQNLELLQDGSGVEALIQDSGQSGSRGADAFSGALVADAGKGQFEALRAKFNPNKNLTDAETKAMADADANKKTSAERSAAWGDLAKRQQEFDAKKAAEKEAEGSSEDKAKGAKREADAGIVQPKQYAEFRDQDTPQNRIDYMMGGVDPKDGVAMSQRMKEISEYQKAMTLTTQNSIDQTFNDFNSTVSPVNWITDAAGIPDVVQSGGQEYLGQKGAGSASGSTKGTPIPWNKVGPDGFFVFRQMTPQDWDVLNHKPPNGPNGQIAWIKTKAAMLRNGNKQGG